MAEVVPRLDGPVFLASELRSMGEEAAAKLADARRLEAEALALLVEYDDARGFEVDGYLTPQRHLVCEANLDEREANRLVRLARFCHVHPQLVAELESGRLSLDHVDELSAAASHVRPEVFSDALPDLIAAAAGVDLRRFVERLRSWQWRVEPEITEEDVEVTYEGRHLSVQPGLFGGAKGSFELDAASTVVFMAALETEPDPVDGIEPARSLRQRRADRLVEIAGLALNSSEADLVADPVTGDGARRLERATVDVVIDVATLMGADFGLDDHRTPGGDVDWDSIVSAFALTGMAPRPVLEQFMCDASWRALVMSGSSVVLDYSQAKPEIAPALRRAVRRRDQHCQFHGCDRHWTWCDVHHLIERSHGGVDSLDNLALVCRRHHTMIHQGG